MSLIVEGVAIPDSKLAREITEVVRDTGSCPRSGGNLKAFDGTWSIEMPAAGTACQTSAATCPALQMNVEIKDSKVIGSLERAPTTALVVKPGEGPASALSPAWCGRMAT